MSFARDLRNRIRRRAAEPPPAAALGRGSAASYAAPEVLHAARTGTRRRQDFAPPFLPPAAAQAWEAFLIFSDGDGSAEEVDNLLFSPSHEVLASGRIVAVYVIEDVAEGFVSKVCAQHSDDAGKTWTAKLESSLDVSPFLHPAFAGGMTLVETGGAVHAYFRGLTVPNTDKIYRKTYDGTAWTAANLFYDGAQAVTRFRAARRRDRGAAGMLVAENVTGGSKIAFVPIDSNGNAGAAEAVDAGPIGEFGADRAMALRYEENGNPVALARFEVSSAQTGTGKRKVFDGGWPASWADFAVDDPPTDPDSFLLIMPSFSELSWGGSVRASQSDAHALKEPAGAPSQPPVMTYRKRVAGRWTSETVDFRELKVPITGPGAAEFQAHSLGKLVDGGRAAGVLWMTAASSGHPFTLWFVRRRVENA